VYCFAVVNSSLAAGKNHLAVFNGAGSGLVLRVWRVEVVPYLTAAVAGVMGHFSLLRTTTGGTITTPAVLRKFDPNYANLPAQVAAGVAFSAQPTVTAATELAALAVNNEETAAQGFKVPLFEAVPDRRIDPVIVREGGGVVVQQPTGTLATVGGASVFIYFTADPS
jgi:hypothetical protein